MTPSDAVLIEQCRGGSSEAWRTLVRRYRPFVYAIASRQGLTSNDAADVTQATFAQLLKQLDGLRNPDSVGGWLAIVTRRLAWQLRYRLQAEIPSGLQPDTVEVSPAEVESIASQLWVHQSVMKLDEPYRTIVIALFFEPEPPAYEELARRLDRPVGSIGPTRARALARLQQLLEDADSYR